jgi:hypothetical protein
MLPPRVRSVSSEAAPADSDWYSPLIGVVGSANFERGTPRRRKYQAVYSC